MNCKDWARLANRLELPDQFLSNQGEFLIAEDSQPLSDSQFLSVRNAIRPDYKLTVVSRFDLVLGVVSFYDGGSEGVLITVRQAALTNPEAIPEQDEITVIAQIVVREEGEQLYGVVVDPEDTLITSATASSPQVSGSIAWAADYCNCGASYAAVFLWIATCTAAATTWAPPAVGACIATGGAMTYGAYEYCDRCEGTHGVTLQPAFAHGWQTAGSSTKWTVTYNPPQPDKLRVGLAVSKAYMNSLTGPHSASNWKADFTGVFSCCISTDRVYDVIAWVEFPTGSGYASGKVLVHKY